MKRSFFLLTLAISSSLFSCSNGMIHHNYVAYGYGTFWDIHLYEGTGEECKSLGYDVNASSPYFDVTATGQIEGGLNRLNATHDYVTLDPMVIEALQKAEQLRVETEGAFDYRLGNLTDSWIACLEQGKALEPSIRDDLLYKALSTSVEINGHQARRLGEGKIDLNALSKGYYCNKIKETLVKLSYTKYLVNAGTSSLLIGEKGSGDGTVRVIMSDTGGRDSFHVKNVFVSCSSINRQHYEIEGKTYSHIVDPSTGEAISKYQAVYLVGQDGCALDAYSTAAMVRDLDFGKSLENKGIKIAYIRDSKVLYATSGFLD